MLLDEQGRWGPGVLQGELAPTHTIRTMAELVPLLREHFDVRPPAGASVAAGAAEGVVVHSPPSAS